MSVHTGKKPYECLYCEKVFSWKRNLVGHMVVHTGERSYGCSHCQKAFSQKSNLVKHMIIHTGEKPYRCAHCQKAFSEKNKVVKHMTVQTGEKPYECSHCQKTFSQRSSLMWHMKLHKGEEPSFNDNFNQDSCCKVGQTCCSSSHSKHHCGRMSSHQTPEDYFMCGSPEEVKQEVGAGSIIYKTDRYPEGGSIINESFTETEMDEIDIVKEEF